MKKFFAMGVLALTAAGVFHQQASAWCKAGFSVGLNWGWQSGGNNLLWGVWRNGQPGGTDFEMKHRVYGADSHDFHHGAPDFNHGAPMGIPYPTPLGMPGSGNPGDPTQPANPPAETGAQAQTTSYVPVYYHVTGPNGSYYVPAGRR
jgi:hypothetical protein